MASRKNSRRARNNPPESVVALRARFRHQYGNDWASNPKIKALYDAEKRAMLHPPKQRVATPAPPPPRAAAPRAAVTPGVHRVPTCDDCGAPATRVVMDEGFGMKRPFCDFHGEERALANPRRRRKKRMSGPARRNSTPREQELMAGAVVDLLRAHGLAARVLSYEQSEDPDWTELSILLKPTH